jgi:hypothetical protein
MLLKEKISGYGSGKKTSGGKKLGNIFSSKK